MTVASPKVLAPEAGPLLRIRGLRVDFTSRDGSSLTAVRGLDIELSKGEVLGIVGESGSGKSLGMLASLGLQPRNAVVSGSVSYKGRELVGRPGREMPFDPSTSPGGKREGGRNERLDAGRGNQHFPPR